MKYLWLIYNEEEKLEAMSQTEWEALVGEALAYDDELRQKGHLIGAQALQPAQAATTIRVRTGEVSTAEGPAAGPKEQLRGFMLIDARDLNEAIQVASKMPQARVGSIEVHPIVESE